MNIDNRLKINDLSPLLNRFFALSAKKIRLLDKAWDPAKGTPVFTRKGTYTTRGWTEWTQGFQYGCQILQFDATGDEAMLELGRRNTLERMAPHLSHTGVHDHGFNNISTYGNLRRLALEGKSSDSADLVQAYEIALKVSGAVQAARWTTLLDGTGFIHSFNGPHSLFSDTIRSCRSLVVADRLGHMLMSENDRRISLLDRAMQHICNTLKFNVYYGAGRDAYDVRGRVAHEGIFNTTDGRYRCPSTQQGYSPFSTWTRGLAWVLLGCAEQLEFFAATPASAWKPFDTEGQFHELLMEGALSTADFFIENTASDGIPFWDTGAPGVAALGDYQSRPSEPDNLYEPVDSSAAAIAAQGLLRLGHVLTRGGKRYWQAGLTVAKTLFSPPYLSVEPKHQGLLLHSVYHRPNGWDYVPKGHQAPQGESSLWGDYHTMELAVYLIRQIRQERYLTFF
ncbi:MAG TPA: glycosyl hydrolase [Candidatus Hydrogenedentes bacterium]|nr:glycosyl hydrolase [Candidatus Hydrogenedentota bacterium]